MRTTLWLLLLLAGGMKAEINPGWLLLASGDTLHAEYEIHWSKDVVRTFTDDRVIAIPAIKLRTFQYFDQTIGLIRRFEVKSDPQGNLRIFECMMKGSSNVFRRLQSPPSEMELRHYAYYQKIRIPAKYQYYLESDRQLILLKGLVRDSREVLGEKFAHLIRRVRKDYRGYSSELQWLLAMDLYNQQMDDQYEPLPEEWVRN